MADLTLAIPRAAAPETDYCPYEVVRSRDRVAEGLLYAQIIGATFLQKFAVPLGGQAQAYIELVLMLAAVAVGLATQRLDVKPARLALFLIMSGGISVTQLLGGRDFSVASVALLVVTHFSYAFGLRAGASSAGVELEFFQKVMAILAVMGIAQYFLQYAVGWRYAFYLDRPSFKAFVFQGFHELNPLGYGSHRYKSNGVFFLEPAIFSQFLAIAVIIEVIYFQVWKRALLYLAAIGVTFSGTGLLLLGVLMPVYLIRKRHYVALACLLLVVASASLWAPLLGMEKLVGRVGEFSNDNTSGFARFISVFLVIRDFLFPNASALLFGMGAGSFKDITGNVSYAVFDPSWGKALFEYGLIGFLLYLPLLAHVFYTSPRSFYLKAALALQFLFLGEYVLAPTVHGLILALLAWPGGDRMPEKDPQPQA